ncbi:hypothetical protein DFA_01259 [Cavenderia fasciculata]|uniref:Transmembrane protein n=1 Tax=Cavenderia fasciculata TaxID=261658 RepID=F4PRU2_CACFS|nr:uncharacterized protein DFA_01259 [Cavenderia fasciculata]EGG21378.1 hypothetical protein DFA_01259 [Cavenderia fasciculata]|eukprot:XP_004359228.1 hypothetical protein DFA_01259 [Cavenderia fasciculata]
MNQQLHNDLDQQQQNFHNEMWRRRLAAGHNINGINNNNGGGFINNITRRVGDLLPSKDSSFSIFAFMVALFWFIFYLADVQTNINVYQHYVIGTCYFQRFHNIEWTQSEESYTFHGIVEVLVNTNKNTKLELNELYPSVIIMSSQQQSLIESNNQNNQQNNQQNNRKYLYLPFRTNLSIEQPVEEISYLSKHPPVEVANDAGPFSHPHKCFFHPLSKEVASERSVLPLVSVGLLAICSVAVVILMFLPSLRLKFDQQVPLILFFYAIVQLATLNIGGSIDYTIKDLLGAVITRVVVIIVGDVLYEYLSFNTSSRFHY